MNYNYRSGIFSGSTCHILEFNPKEVRFDTTVGIRNKLEPLSKIEDPKKGNDEVAVAKINGGFFAMNGKTEHIGTFVDEGLYYNMASSMYPTAVFGKDFKLALDQHPSQDKLSEYQKTAFWAIGCPWLLVKDGKANYLYNKNELIAAFGHPYQKAPRTMMGQKKDGTIVWVVVDGRKAKSPGYTIINQSNLMIDLGCEIAFNLDGGGSSEMIIDGKIVNRPSDGVERYIGTAFVAYAKKNVKKAPIKVDRPEVVGIRGIVVSNSGLIIRETASTASARLTAMPRGAAVTVLNRGKKEEGFYKVRFNGITGYSYAPFIKLS